jgi:hypothetical protein
MMESPLLERPRSDTVATQIVDCDPPTRVFDKLLSGEREQGVTWATVARKLQSFYALEDDWDGDGASAPSREAIESARDFVADIRGAGWPLPRSNPLVSPMGTICFIWNEPSGYILEIEIDDCGTDLTVYDANS